LGHFRTSAQLDERQLNSGPAAPGPACGLRAASEDLHLSNDQGQHRSPDEPRSGECAPDGDIRDNPRRLAPGVAEFTRATLATPQAVSQLLSDSGIEAAEVVAEDGRQVLQSPDDWWAVVQGSGYRWTLEQRDKETAARVRDINLETLRNSHTRSIETNVIYAVAAKDRM
jgi:hypothetical protein